MNLLPIGSVVRLQGGERPLMVYGRKHKDVDSGIEYDYLGCLYPEGYISQDFTYLFNHEIIEDTLFTGFSNEREQELLEKIKQYSNRSN